MASRASLDQGRHDGGAECARAACHHNMPITVIHVTSLIKLASLTLHRFRDFEVAYA
jgi:hypothetical protein